MAMKRPDGVKITNLVADGFEQVDQGLVKRRKPGDIPAYNREVVQLFAIARGQSSWAAAK